VRAHITRLSCLVTSSPPSSLLAALTPCDWVSLCVPVLIAAWLEQGTLQRVVMVVTNSTTTEVVERWTFSVQTDPEAEGYVCNWLTGILPCI
jgi:hypothetical protein